MAQSSTYIDVTLLVALVQVKQDGSFMQISQHGHVFYPIDAGLVHWQDLFSGKGSLGALEHLEEWGEGQIRACHLAIQSDFLPETSAFPQLYPSALEKEMNKARIRSLFLY